MGTAPGKRKVGGDSKTKKRNKQKTRGQFEERHVDQVWEDVRKPPEEVHDGTTGPVGTTGRVELDESIPGYGKHFCLPCSRYFQTAGALLDHNKTKPHKRRVKLLHTSARPHRQADADAAGGLGPVDNGPKLRSSTAAAAAMVQ